MPWARRAQRARLGARQASAHLTSDWLQDLKRISSHLCALGASSVTCGFWGFRPVFLNFFLLSVLSLWRPKFIHVLLVNKTVTTPTLIQSREDRLNTTHMTASFQLQ